jgi:O-antigen ligase
VLEIFVNKEILMLAGTLFFLALLFLVFFYSDFIPHFLVAIYFSLPLAYKYLEVKSLPLTTVFTIIFGPIVFLRASRQTIFLFWPVGFYILIVIFSSIANGVSIWEIKSYFITIIITFLCTISLDSSKLPVMRQFNNVIIVWIILNACFSILQIFGGKNFYLISVEAGTEIAGIERGYGLIGMATQIGVNFCLGVPLIAATLLKRSSHKWIYRLLFIISIIGLVLTFSRGAIIGTLTALFVLYLCYKKQNILILSIIIILLIFFFYKIIMFFLPTEYSNFLQGYDSSAASRLPFTQVGLRMFSEKPLIGFGFGGFWKYCVQYGSHYHVEAHNTYMQVLVEYGILGLGFFLVALAKSMQAYIQYFNNGLSSELREFSLGYLCALIAIMINGLVHCFEWNLILWLPMVLGYKFASLIIRERSLPPNGDKVLSPMS